MNEIATITKPLTDIGMALTPDQVAEIIQRVAIAKDAVKKIDEDLKDFLIDYLEDTELQIGTTRYFVGTKKKVVCTNTEAAFVTLLDVTGGDFSKVIDCLASQPLKHGMCKYVMGKEAWGHHFTEIVEKDLKTGKAKKEVKAVDERFVRKTVQA